MLFGWVGLWALFLFIVAGVGLVVVEVVVVRLDAGFAFVVVWEGG